jgi:hypothetical protein
MAMQISAITVVSDDSGEIKDYKVSLDPVRGIATCACEAYRYSKPMKICKHILFVAQELGLG